MFEKMKSKLLLFPMAVGTMAAGSVVGFAAGETTETVKLPTVTITTEMLTPLVDGVVANLNVILPVGLGLFGIFLGIRIIPGLISRFIHM